MNNRASRFSRAASTRRGRDLLPLFRYKAEYDWYIDGQTATAENVRPNPNPLPDPHARIYTVTELAALHRFSRRTVIRLYENEPGVQVLQSSREHQQRIGRRYRTLRIPRHVYLRVKNRIENK